LKVDPGGGGGAPPPYLQTNLNLTVKFMCIAQREPPLSPDPGSASSGDFLIHGMTKFRGYWPLEAESVYALANTII
jgi:hypothetical protein